MDTIREIKFRAWIITEKQMITPFVEFNTDENTLINIMGVVFSKYWTPKDVVFMQYTGITDHNDKEIYEGDFLDIEDYGYIVKWDIDSAGYYLDNIITTDILTFDEVINNEIFVIGNIYENPELLN